MTTVTGRAAQAGTRIIARPQHGGADARGRLHDGREVASRADDEGVFALELAPSAAVGLYSVWVGRTRYNRVTVPDAPRVRLADLIGAKEAGNASVA